MAFRDPAALKVAEVANDAAAADADADGCKKADGDNCVGQERGAGEEGHELWTSELGGVRAAGERCGVRQ